MMKPQDIAFFLILAILVWRRSLRFSVVAGLLALFFSIPLFATWTFFTAERLTWYAATFFILSIFLHLWEVRKGRM